MQRGKVRTIALVVSTLAWVGALATGLFVLCRYDGAPAPAGEPPSYWPAGSAISQPHARPALLLFAHPQCPCTRASLDELISLMTHTRGLASVYVVFSTPADAPESWTHSASWNYAASIPDVRVIVDKNAREAERFGVLASGHVLLYGTDHARGKARKAGSICTSGWRSASGARSASIPWRSRCCGPAGWSSKTWC